MHTLSHGRWALSNWLTEWISNEILFKTNTVYHERGWLMLIFDYAHIRLQLFTNTNKMKNGSIHGFVFTRFHIFYFALPLNTSYIICLKSQYEQKLFWLIFYLLQSIMIVWKNRNSVAVSFISSADLSNLRWNTLGLYTFYLYVSRYWCVCSY